MKNRKTSLRLSTWDYTQPAAYVITLCTHERLCLLGQVKDECMVLSPLGELAYQVWQDLPNHYPNIYLDAFIIMPNHIHGIIVINEIPVGEPLVGSLKLDGWPQIRCDLPPLHKIINRFKSTVSVQCIKSAHQQYTAKLWQRGYYDHIIRNEADLDRCRHYITNNPAQWALDQYHPTKRSL